MKSIWITIFFVLILAYPGNTKKEHNEFRINVSTNSKAVAFDKFDEFLSLFKEIKPSGLHVYPPKWDRQGKLIQTPFEGTRVDVNNFAFLDEKVFFNLKACREGQSNIFAIGKFEISDKYIGLITRQHSQNDESLIELMLWEKQANKIIRTFELADSFGDEGWYFDKESWIKEFSFNENLKIVTRRKDCSPNDDFTKFSYTDSLQIYQLHERQFVPSSLSLSDTVNYKLKQWK
jgi:hypothetical protein